MKGICVDGKVMTIGSFNQDHWSFYCNNEANLLIQKDTKAFQQFNRIFAGLQRECRPVDFDEKYSPMEYVENSWWAAVLKVSYWMGNNRK
jgi:phosphatidylserine/phosphatidylglycerophosphate/cardiolipin synthase-like enzyme